MLFRIPQGFRCSGVACGIKAQAEILDLTLIVSDRPATAAGVYTTNVVRAAPVEWDRQHTPSRCIRAVVANSGNANACTGDRGRQDCQQMAQLAAQAIEAQTDEVLVLSTGIIGHYLPMDRIALGIQKAGQSLARDESTLEAAARGILTTDTRPKLAGRTLLLDKHGVPLSAEQGPGAGAPSAAQKADNREILITGMAKGAGMIAPNLATMLAVILTDAALEPSSAQALLHETIEDTFNCLTIDGHRSTNDTVLLVANGAAGSEAFPATACKAFQEAFHGVCEDLARSIAADGEGASHLVTVHVRGCTRRQDAHQFARTVAESLLVKTAIAGADPNWGRIVSAAGYAGPSFDPQQLLLRVNGFLLFASGQPTDFNPQEVSASLRQNRDTLIELDFGEGSAEARVWTTDLTTEYVRINAEYHT